MAVTKEVYTLTAGFTPASVIGILEQAFIDAGLMTGWHDSFSSGGKGFGVLECVYDPTKTFGTTYYLFTADANRVGVSVGTGWDTVTNTFTGTQFLDYYVQPPNTEPYLNYRGTNITTPLEYYNTSALSLYRYTSTASVNQSWFVFQQGLSVSNPFAIHHPAQSLYSWLDLDLGMIPGLYTVATSTVNTTGNTSFYMQENLLRAYPCGQAIIGYTNTSYGGSVFSGLNLGMYSYVGSGKTSDNAINNLSFGANGKTVLPIASAAANPAYTQDYNPICSELPWTSFSPGPLATDFGVYMHYANNTLNFEDRFVVDPGVEEWEILDCTNNFVVTTAASPTFIARVV
jgi:hypothetical protein